MRLWHKDLISVLPRQQLLGQWRECCAIAQVIHDKGTPNHALVNKITSYSYLHFLHYSYAIVRECMKRGYNISPNTLQKLETNILSSTSCYKSVSAKPVMPDEIFKHWHNTRYLKQCLMNLQEKFDCGLISLVEWQKIEHEFKDVC